MRGVRRFFVRLMATLSGRHDEERLREEIEEHLAFLIADHLRAGLTRAEADRRARQTLGGIEALKEAYRDERRLRVLETLVQDLRYAVRVLRRNPGFASVAILSLALGIGVNTAMFQLVDAVRLRDLPVRAPAELALVRIGGDGPAGNFTARYGDLSAAQWDQIERRQQAFTAIGAWSPRQFNLADGGAVRRAEGMFVSGAFFDMLGVTALRGRVFSRFDDTPACGMTAVVSHAFWRRQLGTDPQVIGRSLRVDRHAFTIVGVTPERFAGIEVGRSYDVALPLCAESVLAGVNSQLAERRFNYWLSAIGRLRDGWTIEQATAHLRSLSPQIFAATLPPDADPDDAQRYAAMWLHAVPAGKGVSWLRVDYERSLWLLLASAGLVLVIVCGNLANLLLARGRARSPEIAVRLAVGASKGRIVLQLLTESLLLAGAGAGLGLLIAGPSGAALVSLLVTADNPVTLAVRSDGRALGFSIVVGLLTCVAFALVPAMRTAGYLRASTRGGAGGGSLLHRTLLVGQVTLCTVLVASALLFGRSLYNLIDADLGFEPDPVMVTSVDTRRLAMSDERTRALFDDLLEVLRATPGVTAAARSDIIPMSGWESRTRVTFADGRRVASRTSSVSPGYFATVGASLIAGRDFGPSDGAQTGRAAIVNEAFARAFLAGADPIGHDFLVDGDRVRIIGLVGNTKYRTLSEVFQPIVFFPASQMPSTASYARYVVRSRLPKPEGANAIRDSIAAFNQSLDIDLVPLATQIQSSVIRPRLLAALGGGFGAIAGLLAALGIYGLLSYSVEMRRREIGIRMALGADRRRVAAVILREAGWLLGLGSAAGLALTLASGRAVASLLYGLPPNDPTTLAATVATLVTIGLIAAYMPARRAAAVDPLTVIRQP
jgi:putative ABC transport system permease protein